MRRACDSCTIAMNACLVQTRLDACTPELCHHLCLSKSAQGESPLQSKDVLRHAQGVCKPVSMYCHVLQMVDAKFACQYMHFVIGGNGE